MIEGQTLLNIRETNSYQSEEIRSMKNRIRLLETQEFPFVRHRDFDAKGDLIVGSADNTYDNLAVGLTNGFVLQVDNTQTLGVKWATIPTAGIADASVTNAKLANMAAATVKGRALGAGTGAPVDLTATQLNAIVGTVDLTLAGKYVATGATASFDIYDQSTNAASIRFMSDAAGVLRIQNIVGAAVNRLTLSSAGKVTLAAGVEGAGAFISTGASAEFRLYNRATNANSISLYSPTAGEFRIYNQAVGADKLNLTSAGSLSVSPDTNTPHTFGRAVIGYDTSNNDYATFAHYDRNNGTDSAIAAGPTGDVYVRASNSQALNLGSSGVNTLVLLSTGGTLTGDLSISDDLTVTDDVAIGGDLYVTDTLAVGIATPDSKAHIHKGSAGSVSARADAVLTVENNGDMTGLQMLAPAGSIQRIVFGDADDNDINMFQCLHSNNTFVWTLGASDSITMAANNLRPSTSGTAGLGNSSFKWDQVWANTGTIQTSDEREKRNVKPSDLGLDFITRLQPISWVFADQPAYEYDSEDGRKQIVPERKFKRPHYGLSAQQVRKVLDDLGLEDFAGYIHDAEADVYALRYNEFIGPLIMAVQELAEQIKELQNGPGKTH